MARELIDRNQINYTWWEHKDGTFTDGVTLQSIVQLTPIVDAVEVIRCKDCKHYKPRNQSAHWKQIAPCCMRSAALQFPENGFCSYGERKDK